MDWICIMCRDKVFKTPIELEANYWLCQKCGGQIVAREYLEPSMAY